jgi:RNA polymerase sigma factor (sigma-70 family)
MPHTDASVLVHHIRRLAASPTVEPPDGDLLNRYLDGQDEAAFAELVRRHGPMVLGVARSVLADAHEAEDVFQAAFLVLARRAASIRRRESVASFLHGVALRLAHRARAGAGRRHERERQAAVAGASMPADLTGRELREVLHAEMARLPEHYRAALVLCYLEELTQDEAARHLGASPATVKGRLDRGRAMLRRRLTRRGLSLAVPLCAGLWSPGPASAALAFAADKVSPAAAALAADACSTHGKLLAALTAVVVVGFGLGAWVAGAGGEVPAPTAPPPAVPPGPRPAEARPALDVHGDPLPAGAVARLGTVRFRHGARPSFLSASPDGKLLATAGRDGNVRLWEVPGGREVGRLEGHKADLCWAVFAPDGKTLATADGEAVRVWAIAARRLVWEDRTAGDRCALAFAVDGKALTAVGPRAGVLRRDAATGERLSAGPPVGLAGLYAVAFSPAGKQMATAVLLENEPGIKQPARASFKLRDAVTGDTLRRIGEGDAPDQMLGEFLRHPQLTALSADGKTFAAATHWSSHLLRLFDVGTGREMPTLRTNPGVFSSLCFAPAGKVLATGDTQGYVCLWDAATGKERWSTRAHYREVIGLTFLAGGEMLASLAEDGVVRLWDAATGKETNPLHVPEAPLEALAVAPDGGSIFTAGDPTIRRWDPTTGNLLARHGGIHAHTINGLACSADGKALASVGNDYLVAVYDVAAGKCRRWWQGDVYQGKCVALAPDGKTLASGHEDGTWVLWNAATGAEQRRVQAHKWRINSLAFSPDGKFLATSAADPPVRLNEVATGRSVWTPGFASMEVKSLAFSPDAKTLAAGTDGTDVIVCSAATGEYPQRLEAKDNHGLALAFSPDGRLLATGGRGGVVHLWNTRSWDLLGTLRGHDGPITALAFLPDGKRLVSASADTTALVWDVSRLPALPR